MKKSDLQQTAEGSMLFRLRITQAFAQGGVENARAEVSLIPEKVLRCLAGRREVWLTKDPVTQQRWVAKAFLPGRKQRREYKREVQGLKELAQRGIPGPKLLFTADDPSGRLWVVTEFIEKSPALGDALFQKADPEKRSTSIESFVKTLLMHWQHGVHQTDAHYKNFLWNGENVYTIDVGSIRFYKKPTPVRTKIKILSILCRDFPDDVWEIFVQSFERLPADEDTQAILSRLKSVGFSEKLQARKRQALFRLWRKCQRDCTQFRHVHDTSRDLICARSEDPDLVETLLTRCESLMQQGERLKSGNTCTVQKLNTGNRTLIVKRYNPKPLGYRLKHAFSTSRAARSWANAHILRDVGIATAAPVAFVEERKYGLVSHAYYVMEYLEGKTLDVFLNDKEQPSEAITFAVNATARLFEIMLTNCLVHGDTKATNFILSQGSLYVVDLDALKLYRPSRVFERRFERDRSRFLSNWKNRPELKAAFSRALPTP